MFTGFAERITAVRKRSRIAAVFGHGLLDTPTDLQASLLAAMLGALPPGKSRDDVLRASHVHGIAIDDAVWQGERRALVEAYEARLRRLAEGKAARAAEEAHRADYAAWKARRA